MEFTLAIVKPDAFCRPLVLKAMYNAMVRESMKVCLYRDCKMTFEMAEKFYAEHKGKFYYDRLLFNITSGLLRAHVLQGVDVIKKWRHLIGPTKVYKLHHESTESDSSLRNLFGLSDTRNSFHGSDSLPSALREIEIICPDFSTKKEYNDLLPELLLKSNTTIISS